VNLRNLALAAALTALTSFPAIAQGVQHSPPGGDFKAVSSLVKMPDFVPGIGQLFVNPATLPAGPFLAYDHSGRLVSTIYMLPIKSMNSKLNLSLAAPGGPVDHVTVNFNAGHPGVEEPHIHVYLWHVPAADEAMVAK
jgi:hypothetical protein